MATGTAAKVTGIINVRLITSDIAALLSISTSPALHAAAAVSIRST